MKFESVVSVSDEDHSAYAADCVWGTGAGRLHSGETNRLAESSSRNSCDGSILIVAARPSHHHQCPS